MTSTVRDYWLPASLLAALFACWAALHGTATPKDANARNAALAMQIGQKCADELATLAGRSPESAFRALTLQRPIASGANHLRERVNDEIARRVAALSQACAEASPPGPNGGPAVSKAGMMAERLCQARDTTFTLAGMSRPAREVPEEAVARQ